MRTSDLTCVLAGLAFALSLDSAFAQSAPEKRAHHELVYDESTATVLMTGGSTPLDEDGESFRFFNDVWRFGPKGWVQSGAAGDERSGIRLAYHQKDKAVYSYGGYLPNGECSGQLRVLEKGDWKVVADSADMKAAEPGFVYDAARNKLIAFGGSPARGEVHGDTWEWDGRSWQKLEGVQPEGRQAFSMVYDSKRKRTVLYGGGNGSGKRLEDGVWEFDGKKWHHLPEATGPGPRLSPGAAFDAKRGLVVLFGGIGDEGMKGDTWGWDGKTWKKLADAGPPARVMGYLAYDKSRDRIVLFGGRLGWPNDADDTWEWDGGEWRAAKPER